MKHTLFSTNSFANLFRRKQKDPPTPIQSYRQDRSSTHQQPEELKPERTQSYGNELYSLAQAMNIKKDPIKVDATAKSLQKPQLVQSIPSSPHPNARSQSFIQNENPLSIKVTLFNLRNQRSLVERSIPPEEQMVIHTLLSFSKEKFESLCNICIVANSTIEEFELNFKVISLPFDTTVDKLTVMVNDLYMQRRGVQSI